MGMFDTIICDYPLPRRKVQGLDFQTKSLSCLLATYRIDCDGRLFVRRRSVKPRDRRKTSRKAPPPPLRWYRERYTGEIRFYTTLGERHRGWVEFSAYFLKGVLRELHLLEYRLKPGKKQLQAMQKWKRFLRERKRAAAAKVVTRKQR